jgi:hypothetical protein
MDIIAYGLINRASYLHQGIGCYPILILTRKEKGYWEFFIGQQISRGMRFHIVSWESFVCQEI